MLYPATPATRDRFVLERRGARALHDPWRYQGLTVEDERTADGGAARTATVFLTGRECPWRCLMCDLWRSTTTADTPPGAIPAQIVAATRALRARQEPVTQIKLYNAGSFFDPRAVPDSDYPAIARELDGLTRVIVESHPALIGPRVDRLLDVLEPELEVAMGLETAHPEALERLNKQMTIDQFARAADTLRSRNVAVRAFLLVFPPFIPADGQDAWLLQSIDTALSCGASVVSLIPTRSGNGALEALAADGSFRAPRLVDIERAVAAAQTMASARSHEGRDRRIFVDLWDLERFAHCPHCLGARRARLHAINLEQAPRPPFSCRHCASGAPG
jgi:hypothetical protein